MILRTLLVAASFALVSGTAFATGCPREMKAIDGALPKAKLTEAQTAEVKKLRAEGEKLHAAGNHKEAMEVLDRAKDILKI